MTKISACLEKATPYPFYCPTCGATFMADDDWAGRQATCRKCDRTFTIPAERDAKPMATVVTRRRKGADERFCGECGEIIKTRAEACPHCGVRQISTGATPLIAKPIAVQPAVSGAVQPQNRRQWNPVLAAFLSFLIPGLGQHYKGQSASGLFWFTIVGFGYVALVIPGLVLHLVCIIGAATGSQRS